VKCSFLPLLFRSLVLALLLGAMTPIQAEGTVWTALGDRTVNDRAEFDTIRVGPDAGRFKALKLAVEDSPVLIRRVEVHFGNGETLVRERNARVRQGLSARRLDLPGGARIITHVVFHYEAASPGFERARITLLGQR